MPVPVKSKAKKKVTPKDEYLVRYGFDVLIERGKSKSYHTAGEKIELTKAEAKRVQGQIEPYSDEVAKLIQSRIEANEAGNDEDAELQG